MDIDRIKAALARFVEQATAKYDLCALYPCTVVAQNGDGTLELKPDDPRFGPGLSSVPVRLGVPGLAVTVKAKSRVLLGFENADPQRPIATVWDTSSLDTLTVTAVTKVVVISPLVVLGDEANAQPVARLGDVVECVLPPQILATGTVNALPFTGLLTIVDRMVGVITTGGTKAKAS